MSASDGRDKSSGEILEPEIGANGPPMGDSYIALISQYTERPDLLIDALEKNDPGFVHRMNKSSERRAEAMSNARFRFGGIQAYVGLAISALAAISTLGFIGYSVINGTASFGVFASLTIFYAVSQGGPSGFVAIVESMAAWVSQRKNDGS